MLNFLKNKILATLSCFKFARTTKRRRIGASLRKQSIYTFRTWKQLTDNWNFWPSGRLSKNFGTLVTINFSVPFKIKLLLRIMCARTRDKWRCDRIEENDQTEAISFFWLEFGNRLKKSFWNTNKFSFPQYRSDYSSFLGVLISYYHVLSVLGNIAWSHSQELMWSSTTEEYCYWWK